MLMKRTIAILALGIITGVGLSLGTGVWADRDRSQLATLPTAELRTFTEVFDRIKKNYVEEVDDKTLIENAIRGMLSGLDPHSTYMDESTYKDLREGTKGEFGGLGIQVGMEDGFVKVISPIDDTPAYHAGVKSGDLIIRLDSQPVKGLSLSQAVKLMKGKPGTSILLTIVREGAEKPLKIKVVRDVIKTKSVRSKLYNDHYGYIRITTFQINTASDLLKELKKLRKAATGGKLDGLVLDLRNNPGGVLRGAVNVSDAFLREGLIVYTQGRVDDAEMSYKASPDDQINDAPIVVLVNGGSASASEIVAGALQDHKRAIIMGTPTFGKGSVQSILQLDRTTALKLTTARYFTPAGRSIQAEGIVPDVLLDSVKVTAVDTQFDQIKERDLSGHLSNGSKVNSERKDGKESIKATNLASEDYPLFEALNLLKGLQMVQARAK
ncbi:MAG: S41 family peptidase [Gammaproteobacteria bacterium]|nr:S41 family peptidase [Gammaproteobacteria bacterium]